MPHHQITLWASAAEAFDERHRLVSEQDRSFPTPCGEFDVQALIDHAIGTQIRFAHFFGGTTPESVDWEQARAGMRTALADPAGIEGVYDHPFFGEISRLQLLAIATNDLLIHTWDLARAIGADETLPSMNLQSAIDGINAFPPRARAMLFADPVEVPDDANLQTRLLAVAGRSER